MEEIILEKKKKKKVKGLSKKIKIVSIILSLGISLLLSLDTFIMLFASFVVNKHPIVLLGVLIELAIALPFYVMIFKILTIMALCSNGKYSYEPVKAIITNITYKTHSSSDGNTNTSIILDIDYSYNDTNYSSILTNVTHLKCTVGNTLICGVCSDEPEDIVCNTWVEDRLIDIVVIVFTFVFIITWCVMHIW